MKSFRDNAGRAWTVCINVTAVKRCRSLLGVDLPGLVDGGFDGLGKLLSDLVSLVDVLYVLCRDDAERLNVTDEDFGRALWGDALQSASDAFVEELADFFPDPRVRAGIRRVIEAGGRVKDRLMERMTETLDSLDPDDVANGLMRSSANSRESSASTPGPSPSANSH